ncbi:MAG: SDR family oxidoreductase [Pseudomonadota bacterium]|nr:SDR family oxidoreductase [Pseudomonadota bacterium]
MSPTSNSPARTVLVTGGGRGIGAAVSRLAARHGWAVAVNFAQGRAAADEVVKGIRDAGGIALAIQADVADIAQVEAMYSQVDASLPPLGGLVNNAGVVDLQGRVDETSAARLQRMFGVNVFGSFYCAREAIRRMSTRHGGQGGNIVNLSSAAARIGAPGQYVDYACAKGAIDVFTLGLAKEVATEGIRVNAVRPGIIETDIHAAGGTPDRARQMAPLVPLQRAGTAAEVAEAVLWLLSAASSYTTGAVLDVTGGR